MAKVTYIGADEEDDFVCTVFGHTFRRNEPVEMDAVPPKLLTNPTFVVDGGPAPTSQPEPDGPGTVVEVLRAQLDARGIKYDRRNGAAKLNELLAAAIDAEDD